MSNRKLIIFGIGELAELANFYFSNDSDYQVCAFTLDRNYIDSDTYLNLPLIPFDEIIEKYSPNEYEMFIAIGYSKLKKKFVLKK